MELGTACARSNVKLTIVLLHARSHTSQSATRIKSGFCAINCSSAPIVRHKHVQFIPNELENDQRTGCPLGVAIDVEQGLLNDPKQRSLQMIGQLVQGWIDAKLDGKTRATGVPINVLPQR